MVLTVIYSSHERDSKYRETRTSFRKLCIRVAGGHLYRGIAVVVPDTTAEPCPLGTNLRIGLLPLSMFGFCEGTLTSAGRVAHSRSFLDTASRSQIQPCILLHGGGCLRAMESRKLQNNRKNEQSGLVVAYYT